MRDLKKVFDNCMILVEEAGIKDCGNIIDVKVNTRAKRRWGQTKSIGYNMYTIDISEILLDEKVPLEALQNTVIHEILHTCPNCMNHGQEWVKRADIVKRRLGYNIKRCSDPKEKGISENILNEYRKPKYVVKCIDCGHEAQRNRMCDIIKHPANWQCGICGGKFQRIK